MKKNISIILCLLVLFLATPVLARKSQFRTFTVVEVTESVVVIQGLNGEILKIEKSLGSKLKVGDRIRYDKFRKHLGETLAPGVSGAPAD